MFQQLGGHLHLLLSRTDPLLHRKHNQQLMVDILQFLDILSQLGKVGQSCVLPNDLILKTEFLLSYVPPALVSVSILFAVFFV